MAEKSRILIIGGTGYTGKFMVQASAKAGHPTFVLVRETTLSDPKKSTLIDSFKNSGVTILLGDLYDHESLVNAIKQVDVVISIVSHQVTDQVNILSAIKESGNKIKRFVPSEFGQDVDRHHVVEPAGSALHSKVEFRRKVEAGGIPYTYVVSNAYAGFFLSTLGQHNISVPPRDKVSIMGDGNVKVIYVTEEDIGTYTIKAVDDPRTLNKIIYLRPQANTLTFNEVVTSWEKKIGKTLERTYIPEDEILKQISESPVPFNFILAVTHSIYVNGDCTNYEIDPSIGVEATELYPDVKYKTVDQYLDKFV